MLPIVAAVSTSFRYTATRMPDDTWYSPDRKPAALRQPTPGFKQWELRNGAHVLVCEFRDDERISAGVDVALIEDGGATALGALPFRRLRAIRG